LHWLPAWLSHSGLHDDWCRICLGDLNCDNRLRACSDLRLGHQGEGLGEIQRRRLVEGGRFNRTFVFGARRFDWDGRTILLGLWLLSAGEDARLDTDGRTRLLLTRQREECSEPIAGGRRRGCPSEQPGELSCGGGGWRELESESHYTCILETSW
jgi:hypothetical protein